MKSYQSDEFCSCFSPPKMAVEVVVEDHENIYPKNLFQNIIPNSVVANSDIAV